LTVNGSLIDSVVVQSTGGWQTWATQTSTVALPTGEHTLRIDSIGGAWNLNWLKFSVTP
jgi:endoglucanase